MFTPRCFAVSPQARRPAFDMDGSGLLGSSALAELMPRVYELSRNKQSILDDVAAVRETLRPRRDADF